MTNTVPLRTVSWAVSAVVWAVLVAGAFTMGMKLPVIELTLPEPDALDVRTETPPPPPLQPPDTPTTTVRAVENVLEPVFTSAPAVVDALPDIATTVVLGPPGPAVAPPPVITNPVWLSRPGAREFERFYPERARERGRGGRVTLDCIVGANGSIACTVARETPEGWGFGAAALKIAPSFRIAPRLEDGRPTEGGTVRVDAAFNIDG